MTELKPCPFCGGEPERRIFEVGTLRRDEEIFPRYNGYVFCPSCGAVVALGTEETPAVIIKKKTALWRPDFSTFYFCRRPPTRRTAIK